MNRTSFLIDGFNLYHSIIDIQRDSFVCTKWLDIYSLCNSFLYWIGNNATLEEIYYFSAFAYHRSTPGVIERHMTYKRCLESKGIKAVMGRFKPKQIKCSKYDSRLKSCPNCYGIISSHEEKETDVAIAAKLLELFSKNSCDTIVLVTGDTDLAPAIRVANDLFTDKSIRFIFPYKRRNNELAKLAQSMTIKPSLYNKFQLPDPLTMPDGTLVNKPITW